MELLHEGVDAIPVTDNPRHDLVEAALMFRRFALDHPALSKWRSTRPSGRDSTRRPRMHWRP